MNAILVLYLLLFGFVGASEKTENNSFVATNEWQEIKEDQSIPKGLHVRINLQTGKKEAKLLDESERNEKNSEGGALSTVPEKPADASRKGSVQHKLKISKKLEEALKNLPREPLSLGYSQEKMDQIKRDYKSYKEIKESFEGIRQRFKSDAEIITELLGEYRNLSKAEQDQSLSAHKKITAQQRILEDFNFLVHQIDNALWFIDEGGLEQVLLPVIVNETHSGLRVQAMRVLGALTLNNPKAQIKVFERNFGSHLSQILISSTNTDELSTALYAFGSLLRKFPLAQQRILSMSGTQALMAVLTKECELKIKAKVATLISDVIVEKHLVATSTDGDPLAAAQYAELNFPEWLRTSSYCDTLSEVISTHLYELLEQPDNTEYFIQTLDNTRTYCSELWPQNAQMRHTLLTLKNRYNQSDDEYRKEVAEQIDKLISALYRDSGPRDEL